MFYFSFTGLTGVADIMLNITKICLATIFLKTSKRGTSGIDNRSNTIYSSIALPIQFTLFAVDFNIFSKSIITI